jgi:hypothetical protein
MRVSVGKGSRSSPQPKSLRQSAFSITAAGHLKSREITELPNGGESSATAVIAPRGRRAGVWARPRTTCQK